MFRRKRKTESECPTPTSASSIYNQSDIDSREDFRQIPIVTPPSGLVSRCSTDFFQYNEFHDSNTLDAQLGHRLQALQDSLQNPELSPSVRNILQTAYNQFERESARNHESLPVYTPEIPPPYDG